ncbi:MAG: S9 family peptidase [Burkholderiales bacterium]|nr:S9 family peptidase [Burkholderiales bacterium]
MRYLILAASFAAAYALLTPDASAQSTSSTLSVEDIWKNPTLNNPQLSRSGKYLAATAPHKGRMNLLVMDIDSRKGTVLTAIEDYDVVDVNWVGDERLVFSLGQANSPTGAGQFDGGGLYVINRDGSGGRRLAPTVRETRARNQNVYRSLDFHRTIPGNTDEIIAEGNQTSSDSIDLYRLNLNTGRTTLLTSGRPADLTVEWLLDSKLTPRVVVAGVKDELTRVVYYRAGADAKWEEIARYSRDKGSVFVPLAFESDDQTLQIATNKGRDTMAVYRYDPKTKTVGELLAAHPRYDMGADSQGNRTLGPIVDFETNKILGYRVEAARPETVWTDPDRARIQASLDAVLPGMINTFRRTPDGKRLLVTSFSDTKATRWYFLDDTKRTMEEVGASRPWLDGKLVEQRPFVYRTRDGLEIPGYLFLPKGYQAGTKLPTVVHIHGGPTVRADRFGRGFGWIEGQLFASRGYAVVVPNFRVTPGLGNKIFTSGFGTLGRQMSEDHEDALKWAIDEGFTDPKRACISGGSYGGYAALQAMVKTPYLFKCAVAGLAVTDMVYQNTSLDTDYVSNPAFTDYWKAIIGTNDLRSQLVRDLSPVNHADKIKGAVFLYAGQDDIRVPIDQIIRMDKALKAAGNPAKAFVIKEKEGHGFGKLENNVDLYTQVLKFLDEQIGSK